MLSLDFETRSVVDLTRAGVHVYAKDPSTKVLCAAYSIDGGPVMLWRTWAKQPMPADLKRALERDTIAAFNASFERAILRDVLKIDLSPERFRCTQARARAQALPAKLELCARALHMPLLKGNQKVMSKWMKPLEDGSWADDPQEYAELCAYCVRDVEVEMQLGAVLAPLNDEEQQDWCINERVNDNGILIDVELCRAAQVYAADEQAEIKARLAVITGGKVTSAKQFARIKSWLGVEGSLDASARAALLEDDDLPDAKREFVELVDDGGRASTAKFAALEARAVVDQRVRGAFIFAGAGQTMRYSSTGAQLHNFIRLPLKDPEATIDLILARAPKAQLMAQSGLNVLTTLSRCLRPTIIAGEGKVLVWADYSAIEARVNPWLSGEDSALNLLEAFAQDVDIYKRQAAPIFGVAEDEVAGDQRQVGKVCVLSFGFGGGSNAYRRMAKNYGMTATEAQGETYKRGWRKTNPWAERFWRALESAATKAVRSPGERFHAGRVSYCCANGTLWCLLPSGNEIAYPFPEVKFVTGMYGPVEELTAMKSSFHPKAGEDEWPRMTLWGGILCENVTQATAAALLRWSLRTLFADGWGDCVIGHIHDEPILEVAEADLEDAKAELEAVLSSGPAWAAGLPLACEIKSGLAYGK